MTTEERNENLEEVRRNCWKYWNNWKLKEEVVEEKNSRRITSRKKLIN